MSTEIFTGIIGICIGFLQGLIIFILLGQNRKIDKICKDNLLAHSDLWKRINTHKHEISCGNKSCEVEMGGVVISYEV